MEKEVNLTSPNIHVIHANSCGHAYGSFVVPVDVERLPPYRFPLTSHSSIKYSRVKYQNSLESYINLSKATPDPGAVLLVAVWVVDGYHGSLGEKGGLLSGIIWRGGGTGKREAT